MNKPTPEELRLLLDGCTGTTRYWSYRNTRYWSYPTGPLVLTDGAFLLANQGDCWWLMDLIVAAQELTEVRLRPDLKRYQFWRITTDGETTVDVTMHEDWDEKDHGAFPPIIHRQLKDTTFPFREFLVWVESGVILLPSEH